MIEVTYYCIELTNEIPVCLGYVDFLRFNNLHPGLQYKLELIKILVPQIGIFKA